MRDPVSTGRQFKRPRDFDPARHLRGNIARFTGETKYEVRIALNEFAAFYAREQPWHRSQVIVERADGGIEITLTLNNLIDVENTVLRWGAHAEALSPPELRANVRAALQTAAVKYR